MSKPPYRVPLLAEIPPPAPGAPTVISSFTGCGGSCLGFRLAGFRTIAALEFVDAAIRTYERNFRGVPIDGRDVREVRGAELRELAGLAPGEELDVLEGSPPCASFSTAGKGAAGWGQEKAYSDTRQRTDDLFFEFARLRDELRPRAFVAENVSGLVKGKAKGYFLEILAALSRGYRVEARLLDAQWLGVPQARVRLIFVGFREDLGIEPVDAFPAPLQYRYSIREALGLPGGARVVGGAYAPFGSKGRERSIDEPAPTIVAGTNGGGPHQLYVEGAPPIVNGEEELREVDLARYAIGPEWDKLRPGEASEKYFNLVRPRLDEPCPTVTQTGGTMGAASVTHPLERRKFTIAELRRLCGFPDDFVLTGTYQQRWERLGRAVPPPMMRAVAAGVRAALRK